MRLIRKLRFIFIALLTFLFVINVAFLRKTVALLLCGVLSFNLASYYSFLNQGEIANAATPRSRTPVTAGKNALPGSNPKYQFQLVAKAEMVVDGQKLVDPGATANSLNDVYGGKRLIDDKGHIVYRDTGRIFLDDRAVAFQGKQIGNFVINTVGNYYLFKNGTLDILADAFDTQNKRNSTILIRGEKPLATFANSSISPDIYPECRLYLNEPGCTADAYYLYAYYKNYFRFDADSDNYKEVSIEDAKKRLSSSPSIVKSKIKETTQCIRNNKNQIICSLTDPSGLLVRDDGKVFPSTCCDYQLNNNGKILTFNELKVFDYDKDAMPANTKFSKKDLEKAAVSYGLKVPYDTLLGIPKNVDWKYLKHNRAIISDNGDIAIIVQAQLGNPYADKNKTFFASAIIRATPSGSVTAKAEPNQCLDTTIKPNDNNIFKLTCSQIAQLHKLLKDSQDPTLNLQHPIGQAYTLLYQWANGHSGVDQASLAWLQGAAAINQGTGPYSSFIRNYTSYQHQLRYGTPLSDSELQFLSDSIGRGVIQQIKETLHPKPNVSDIPAITEIGDDDATPVITKKFNKDINAWSGVVLFPFLGVDTYLNNMLTSKNPSNPLTISVSAYNALAALASLRYASGNESLFNALKLLASSIANYYHKNFGDSGQVTAQVLGDLSGFISSAYGINNFTVLTTGSSKIQLGQLNSTGGAMNNTITSTSSGIINSGGGDDTIISKPEADSYVVVDGGSGNNIIDFSADSFDMTISVDNNSYTNSRILVSSTQSAVDIFYVLVNIQTIKLGSGANIINGLPDNTTLILAGNKNTINVANSHANLSTDTIIFEGKSIAGNVSSGSSDSYGRTYQLNKAALTITSKSDLLTINNFQNGNFGLKVK